MTASISSIPTHQPLLSFKEIDELHQCPKGTAFRAFKDLVGRCLIEGEHFYYLDARHHRVDIDKLRQESRIYLSTVNAVLLTEAGYTLLKERHNLEG